MRTKILLALLTIGTAASVYGQAQKENPNSDSSALIGDWRGDSICQVRPSACNDEKALYHFKKLGDQPNHFSLQADKIVNGQAEEMGTMECSYAPEKHVVTCSTPRLVLHLTQNGKNLDGTMNLPDGTVWRKITLRHD